MKARPVRPQGAWPDSHNYAMSIYPPKVLARGPYFGPAISKTCAGSAYWQIREDLAGPYSYSQFTHGLTAITLPVTPAI